MHSVARAVGDVRILNWSGKITLGEGTTKVRNTVREIVEGGGKKIVINLADVSYIDSAGVGALISAYIAVNNTGGQLRLMNLTKKVRELLAITKLLTVFDVFDTEEAARSSFN